MTKTLCLFHANCADGLGAAWAVHKALGDQVEFLAASYGEDPPGSARNAGSNSLFFYDGEGSIKGRDILIVDFSYPLATLRAIAAEARSVLVLDHHKTAQADLRRLPTAGSWKHWQESLSSYTIGDPREQDNLATVFDLSRSGAGITWDYLHPSTPRPRIIDLIEDRDLWRFKFGDESRAFHVVLTSYDTTSLSAIFARLDMWHNWLQSPNTKEWFTVNLFQEGLGILRAQQQTVASTVTATRRTMRIAGHTVPVANVPPSLASDAGHRLCQPWNDPLLLVDTFEVETDNNGPIFHYPLFSATYHDNTDGKRHFSLRSPQGGADVGQVAKQMAAHFNFITPENFKDFKYEWKGAWNGGDHEHAAGFDAPLGWEGEQ